MTESINEEYIGSDFDGFLAEDNILEKCTSVAKERVDDWKSNQENSGCSIDKTTMNSSLFNTNNQN